VIIDADRRGARDLTEALALDPMVERVPMIVIGTFEHAEAAAPFIERGAERVLPKPINPDTLRRTVLAAARRASPRVANEPLGDMTVDQLATRVASELKQGLVQSLETRGRNVTVPLGDGTDVLAAVWGAIALLREVVAEKSSGAVRFAPSGPEGAVPLAPWSGSERRAMAPPDPSEEVRLKGRTVVVVDDDPTVVAFLSRLLRSAGMEVYEAHDGTTALELALERCPDLVVSDVLMPGLDGLTLCREIKRDIAARDVPVILLSWKEDLLQRVRELGADADGYLRKEATSSVVLQRVADVLRSRARIEARLDASGEVRGRLDGITARLLLELASARQANCRVTVRDSVYLYEVELREGSPRCATRTATDGRFERGPKVLAALLGVSAGRFVIAPSNFTVRADISGSLSEVLKEPIRRARAAQRALRSETLMRVDKIEIDRDALAGYLPVTPEPAVQLLERLAAGEAPRDLILSGEVAPRLLESVLSDVIRRGAVLRVLTGVEVETPLPPAEPAAVREAEHERLFTFDLTLTPGAAESIDSSWTDGTARVGTMPFAEVSPPLPLSRTVTPPLTELSEEPSLHFQTRTQPGVGPLGDPRVEPPSPPAAPAAPKPEAKPVAKIELKRQLAPAPEATPKPEAKPEPAPKPPVRQEPTPKPEPKPELTPKPEVKLELAPKPVVKPEPAPRPEPKREPAKPAPAVEAMAPPKPAAKPEPPPDPPSAPTIELSEEPISLNLPSEPAADEAEKGEADDDERDGEEAMLDQRTVLPVQKRIEFPRARPPTSDPAPAPVEAGSRERRDEDAPEPEPEHTTFRPEAVPRQAERPMSLLRVGLVTVVAAGASFGLVRWVVGPGDAPEASVATTATTAAIAPAVGKPKPAPKPAEPALAAEDLELPSGIDMPADKGLLELETGDKHAIYVDGTFVGMGPRRRVPLDPGKHEVKLRLGADDKLHSVDVRQGRRTRFGVPSASP
jgi:DNA-binding response OmpR family regulator